MAHFLEHLVFKGGEKYPTYRDVNEAAESIGAVLNAYTSHDLVAFHITARAERALEAADLLTDFVGRPRIDADELDRERGVVVQEIARANDQPSVMAEHLIDEAVFGDHPLGRPVLGPAEHIRDTFTREGIVAFRSRRWAPSRGGAFVVGNLSALGENGTLDELFSRFPTQPEPDPYEPAPQAEPRVLVQRARLQPVAPADVLPAADRHLRPAPAGGAGDLLDAARRLDGLAPVRRDPRAARPGLLGALGRARVRRRTDPAAVSGPGVRKADRGLPPDARDRHRAARAGPDRGRGRARPSVRGRAPGRSRSRTPARSRATRPSRRSCTARTSIRTPRSRCSTRSRSPRWRRSPPTSLTSCRSLAWVRTPWRSWRPPDPLGCPARRRRDRSGWVRRIRRHVQDRVHSRRREPARPVARARRTPRRVHPEGPPPRPARPASTPTCRRPRAHSWSA